jgi:ankyrin repeat protein
MSCCATLHNASRDGHVNCLHTLIDQGHDINEKGGALRDWTPLFFASSNGHHECIEILLENGAQINVPDGFGNTPLSYAVFPNHIRCVERLLAFNADVNGGSVSPPLHIAIEKGYLDIIRLLIDNDVVVNRQYTGISGIGITALYKASLCGNPDIVRLLLDQGADRTMLYNNKRASEVASDATIKDLIDNYQYPFEIKEPEN